MLFTLRTKASDDRTGDRALKLATPLANEVVRAEHDGPVLAATPTLTARPTGVHVHGHGADERFPGVMVNYARHDIIMIFFYREIIIFVCSLVYYISDMDYLTNGFAKGSRQWESELTGQSRK